MLWIAAALIIIGTVAIVVLALCRASAMARRDNIIDVEIKEWTPEQMALLRQRWEAQFRGKGIADATNTDRASSSVYPGCPAGSAAGGVARQADDGRGE